MNVQIGIDYSKGKDETGLAISLGDEMYLYKGKEAEVLITAINGQWRCNICGGIVKYDGTKPLKGMWGHK